MPRRTRAKLSTGGLRKFFKSEAASELAVLAVLCAGVAGFVIGGTDGVEPVAVHLRDDAKIDRLPASFEDYLALQTSFMILKEFHDTYQKPLQDIEARTDAHKDQSGARDEILNINSKPMGAGIRHHSEIVVGSGPFGIGGLIQQMTKTQFEVDQQIIKLTHTGRFQDVVVRNALYHSLYNAGQDALAADADGNYQLWLSGQVDEIEQGLGDLTDDPVLPEAYSKALYNFRNNLTAFTAEFGLEEKQPAPTNNTTTAVVPAAATP